MINLALGKGKHIVLLPIIVIRNILTVQRRKELWIPTNYVQSCPNDISNLAPPTIRPIESNRKMRTTKVRYWKGCHIAASRSGFFKCIVYLYLYFYFFFNEIFNFYS